MSRVTFHFTFTREAAYASLPGHQTMTDPTVAGVAPPGFRLPADAQLGVVRLCIANLDRSLRFYRDVIGLNVMSASLHQARLGAHGDDRVLLELREQSGVRPVPKRGLLGLYHFALLLPSRGDLGRFVRHHGALGTPFGAADHSFSEATYLVDPDGLTIEVYADRPRDTWTVRAGEYAAVSDPLDVEDLVGSGGERSWAGVPRGSVIGHVHLYVGDLDAAAAFYHAALGLDRTIWSFPGALFMAAGGYHHHVGTNTWAGSAPVATAADARLEEWELVVPEIGVVAAAARSLQAGGYAVARVGDNAVVARDPWNITVRIST
jgi:catechol 2,3-dioxygenase